MSHLGHPTNKLILEKLQLQTENIRNICVLAHVDHGKTTLVDALISSNGIISNKQTGSRYLDNTEEEAKRGITMKSSAISLFYQRQIKNGDEKKKIPCLINLIDSPGHVDFSSDVAIAIRACDGALLLVDAVEGVCTQTRAVLKQAFEENLRICLVISKIDKLITFNFTPMEAYEHIVRIIEVINVTMANLYTSRTMARETSEHKDANENQKYRKQQKGVSDTHELEFDEAEEQSHLFSPEKGNVIFASAVHGWAFTIHQMATVLFEEQTTPLIPLPDLRRLLWGNTYYDPVRQKVVKGSRSKGKSLKPTFVRFVFRRLWKLDKLIKAGNISDALKLVNLNDKVDINDRIFRSKDTLNIYRAIFQNWIPVSKNILAVVCHRLPSPLEAQAKRVDGLFPPEMCSVASSSSSQQHLYDKIQEVRNCVEHCKSTQSSVVVVYISKMFAVDRRQLQQGRYGISKGHGSQHHVFLAFARVFSGILSSNKPIYVIKSNHNPKHPDEAVQVSHIKLYLMMGSDLAPVDSVPAGNLVAIEGLQNYVLKTATLCSTPSCIPLSGMSHQVAPIVRIAVEPQNFEHLDKLKYGLAILAQADPCVECFQEESGEHVIICLGELHMSRCIDALQNKFARIPLKVSPPIVPFRETLAPKRTGNIQQHTVPHNEDNVASESTGKIQLSIRCEPLPPDISTFLESNVTKIEALINAIDDNTCGTDGHSHEFILELISCFQKNLDMKNAQDILGGLLSFGPRNVGSNILVSSVAGFKGILPQKYLQTKIERNVNNEHSIENTTFSVEQYQSGIISGFQLATRNGPICNEPVHGVCYIIEKITQMKDTDDFNNASQYGRLISTTKSLCRMAFLKNSPRLVEPVYSCQLQCSQDEIGQFCKVLRRRRGKILDQEMIMGTSTFTIEALVPVEASFGIINELRKMTRGASSNAQMLLSHWQVIPEDPFITELTSNENEWGDQDEIDNLAKKIMNRVRKRKGLKTDDVLVVNAEKQRTLARKK